MMRAGLYILHRGGDRRHRDAGLRRRLPDASSLPVRRPVSPRGVVVF